MVMGARCLSQHSSSCISIPETTTNLLQNYTAITVRANVCLYNTCFIEEEIVCFFFKHIESKVSIDSQS